MFSINFLLSSKNNSYKFLDNMFYAKFKIYNKLVKHCKNLLKKLKNDSNYKETLNKYIEAKKTKDSKLIKELFKELNNIRFSYGLDQCSLEKYAKEQQKKYSKYISSQVCQVIAKDIWVAVEKVLFSDGKQIHFKKYNDINTISAKSKSNGIVLKKVNNQYYIRINKLYIPIVFKDYDKEYTTETFKNNLKYCKIKRMQFNNGYRYYVQIIFEGNSLKKYSKGEGTIGIDPGVSTIACTTNKSCILRDLAPNVSKYNKKILEVQKQMERSLRINNKECFKSDGTIKKGIKLKKTKNYYKLNRIFRTLHRKRTTYMDECQYLLVRDIVKQGDSIYYEEMNFKALQKRAKKTERSEKSSEIKQKDGSIKEVKKYKKKKRFGKSLNNKAPSAFLTKLTNKCKALDIEIKKINTITYKASQYNHIENKYIKHELKDRFIQIGPYLVQRDLYSSFLLKYPNKDLKTTNRTLCLKHFEEFLKMHDECINDIRVTVKNRPSSFGF